VSAQTVPSGSPVLEDLQAQVTRLTRQLAELRDVLTAAVEQPPAAAATKPPGPGPVKLDELAEWVQDWLLPTFRRMPGGARGRWCPVVAAR